jgi:signal transduction histidine kinase/EAL domain-containing protein (putative c-di-GMP-specific phosphodiesterase class I)/CheY-like chemotaxis protein
MGALLASFIVTALFATWNDLRQQAALESLKMTQIAQVIGSLSSDAVRDGDRARTFSAIRSVSQMPNVSYARVQATDGTLLAETGAGARLMSDATVDGGSDLSLWGALTTGSVQVTAPVMSQGESVGSITLFSKTPDLRDRVLATVWVTLMGALVAVVVGMVVAVRVARKISGPVIALARVVRGVHATNDYSRPAEIAAEGEVADLVRGFNTMLEGIRERDARIQAQIEGLEGEVQARTVELSLAKDAAESANAAKSDFLAVMSHEIRTPMNGILALSDMLAKSDLPARQQRYADVIAKSGQSLLSIINDILDFSKVEAGKMDLEAIEVDLAEVAEDVASLFSEKAGQKGLDLAVFVHPALPTVMADPVRLRQVVGNLVNNAIKFTEAGGVMICVDRDPADGSRLLFSIEDTGPGIPADKLPTLFEAFTQADQSTTRKYGGTGLGLAICDRLVRSMGGEWKLASTVGTGSTFAFSVDLPVVGASPELPAVAPDWRVRIGEIGTQTRAALVRYLEALGATEGLSDAAFLPGSTRDAGPLSVLVCETEDEAADLPADVCAMVKPLRRDEILAVIAQMAAGQVPVLEHSRNVAADVVHFPGARVLVVDDSEVNREVASEALSRLGVVPTLAEDGVQAVEILRRQSFDLVLMDGSMPNLDGFEATRLIRNEEAVDAARGRTPIVALTAHVVGSGANAWRESGMDGVVHKPFTVSDLLAVLHRFCGERAVSVSEAIPVPEAVPEPVVATETINLLLFDPVIRAELVAMAEQGRSDFVDRVQGLYATNAPLRLADLKAAENEGELEAAARAAHAMKSMSLSLGARAVAAEASQIESTARAGGSVSGASARIGTLLIQTLTGMGLGGSAQVAQSADPPVVDELPGALADLQRGIAAGELQVAYQSLVERNGQPSGKVEALVRWIHPERSRISPAEFVTCLEAEGTIASLTDFVLDRVMEEMADHPGIRVSVNASATEFQAAGFADRIARALAARDFPAARLEIEVTETAMLDIDSVRRVIGELAEVGVGVALDDFGAGYTSLHALRELKFTTLKIDRSFVERCVDDTASAAIIHAVIGVGRSIGMKVVCEGVETAAQAEFLRIAGAHYLQGYFFHRPSAADDLFATLAEAA